MRLIVNYSILGVLIAASFSSQPAFVGATELRGNNQEGVAPPRSLRRYKNKKKPIKKPTNSTTCASSSIVDVQYADTSIDGSFLACMTSDGKSFKIKGVSASFVNANKQSVIDGTSEFDLPDGSMLDEATGTIDLPPGQALKFKEGWKNKFGDGNGNDGGFNGIFDRNRHLAVLGTRSVLVVRVVAANDATSATELRLSDSVFGNGADGSVDSVTLRSQYMACSHGKLEFTEAANRDGTNINIRNGATTVTVPTSTSQGDNVMNNDIADALNAQFGVTSPAQLADHVMYCLPPNTMSGIAYAYIGSWLSVYSDNWCTYLSGQVHEIGHNLGLGHSNENGSYGDHSGMMGISYGQDNGPRMCFNAVKSWQLGWYATRQQTFNADDGIWSGRLIGQVDMNNANANNDEKVLLKLNTGTSTDYYAMFNHKIGTNSETREGGNQVLITRAAGEGTSYAESELVAKLSVNGEYTIPNFDGSGRDLKLVVDDINTGGNLGYADVKVSGGCNSNEQCDDGLTCNGEEQCDALTGLCLEGTPLAGCCGNDMCEIDENSFTCPADCPFTCGGGGCKVLTSTFAGGTTSNGNFFKIYAETDLIVTGFTMHTRDPGTGNVRIWEKAGDYSGDMENEAAWNPIMNDDSVNGAGTGAETALGKFDMPVMVPAGTFRSFYLYSSLGVTYTKGSVEGNAYAENAGEIKFYEGRGSGNLFGGLTWSPRIWNGIIEYGLAQSVANPTNNPTASPINPTNNPTDSPSKEPTTAPVTDSPTNTPTASPINPTNNPTGSPSKEPTTAPVTDSPTNNPTASPINPTNNPTGSPSKEPTTAPVTDSPTKQPTNTMTPNPTNSATPNPTNAATPNPTDAVTPNPTNAATPNPTDAVTPNPTNAATPNLTATYDAAFGAPRCTDVGLSCTSGDTLLDGTRSNVEPNSSNTIDQCTDGAPGIISISGTYHSDESIDKITITAMDGGQLQAGKVVQVEVKVYAWGSGFYDTADFFQASSASNANWSYLGSIAAGGGGVQTLVGQYRLPIGDPDQAIRVNFRYAGSASSCSSGSWDDTDDLVFAVAGASAIAAASDGTPSLEPNPIPALASLSSNACPGIEKKRCQRMPGICQWKMKGKNRGCYPM